MHLKHLNTVGVLIESWLELVCKCLPGVIRAAVVRSHGGKAMSIWPANSWSSDDLQRLGSDQSSKMSSHNRLDANIVQFYHPLDSNGVWFANLYLECKVSDEQIPAVQQLLLWSQAWLALLATQNRMKSQQSDHLLDVLEKASIYDDLSKNAYAFCSHLVTQLPITQAVFCTCFRGRVDVLSVSKTPQYDRRTEPFEQLTRYLESLLKSSGSDQRAIYDEWLLRNSPETLYEVFPLSYDSNVFAYLIVYFSSKSKQDKNVRNQITLFLRYLTSMYFKLYWTQLSLTKRVRIRIANVLGDRPKKQRLMIYLASILVGLVVLTFPVNFKVKAPARIEGKVQRAIVVPEDGYLKEVLVKTGELLKEGQLIAVLDEKSVELEVQRWQNEKQEYEREYNRELTALNHVQMRIAQAKIAQAQAKLSMYQNRLAKTRIVSPIEGVVIKGDLSRAVGAPVKQGQVLYEIAPVNQFKLVLSVSEKDIALLKNEQRGQLQLTAFPSEKLDFEVLAISSVYEEDSRQLQYRVEAKIIDNTTGLLPGMTGSGKIIVNKRPWVLVLMRPLTNKLKIWWWELF